jgi:hypothetical protein
MLVGGAPQYRAALDGGADPATVTAWISETATEERSALAELEDHAAKAPAPLSVVEALASSTGSAACQVCSQRAD